MDDSYIAQIFPQRKLRALAHTIHAIKHTHLHIIYIHEKHGPPSLVGRPVEKGKF